MNSQPFSPLASTPLEQLRRSPLTLLHVAVLLLCACGFAVDLLEIALGGALSTVFAGPPYNLHGMRLSWLVSAVYVGAIIGAPVLGSISDRVGPKRTLTALLIWLAVTSLLAATSGSVTRLTIYRMLSGIALGAYPPLMIAYLTDISPVRRRGAVIFAVCAFAYLAPPAAIFSVRWLTPIQPFGLEGWRWPLLAAGLISGLAGIAFLGLPEAPHWLHAKARMAAVRAVQQRFATSWKPWRVAYPVSDMHSPDHGTEAEASASAVRETGNGLPKARLALIVLLYFLIPWATVSFPLLSGPILLERHFSLSDTLFYVGLANFGPIVATIMSGLVVDRFRRERMLAACAAGMLLSVLLFFAAHAVLAMAVAMLVFGIGSALYMPTMVMFGGEAFAAGVRGRAVSVGWACNRLAAAVAPMLLIPLVRGGHDMVIAGVLCGTLAMTILLLLIAAPRVAGTGLDGNVAF